MADSREQSALHRKVHRGAALREVNAISPTRALRVSFARAGEGLWGLAAESEGIASNRMDHEAAIGLIGPDDLILSLMRGDGAVALAVLARPVVTALIEVQTLGHVTDQPPEDRPYTATDAELSWIFLERALAEFALTLEDSDRAAEVTNLWFEHKVSDARAAGLLLAKGRFQVYSASMQMGEASRTGDLRLILPGVAPKAQPQPAQHNRHEGFRALPVRLRVMVSPLRLSLAQAKALRPGARLDLPGDALDQARLLAADGQVVARGKLGQTQGLRALRIDSTLASAPAPSPLAATLEEFGPPTGSTDDTAEGFALPDVSDQDAAWDSAALDVAAALPEAFGEDEPDWAAQSAS